MKTIRLAAALVCALPAILSAATATFEDLISPPERTTATGLTFTTAPGDGLFYAGVVWDERVGVVGDQYKVAPDGPLFGLPHSGNYFITNDANEFNGFGNGITLTTSLLLTGSWFGRNEYYGFGGGADSITIVALSGATELASVTFNLPELAEGQPEVLSFVDTSAFAALVGITGYRIDHTTLNEFNHNWVADDFQFVAIPEPGATVAAAGALALVLALAAGRRRRA